jgi:adenylate cyclase
MPTPYLEWLDKKDRTQRLEIVDKVFIGRSCKGVDPQKRILVRDVQVSRDHAVISRSAKRLQITDSSKNGTWVNGVRLAAGSSSYGDIIRVGERSFHLHYPDSITDVRDKAILTAGTMVTPSEVVVTNVVADVREFTTFSQAHDSADVYSLMKEIFDTFSAIVSEFKGTIKDYAGDAVYAFWDHYLEPINGQAVLACQAAIHQMQTMKEIRAKLSGKSINVENLQMGWGITTGKVTMSHYGSRSADLALVGDCTNLAFRLSGMANKKSLYAAKLRNWSATICQSTTSAALQSRAARARSIFSR